MKRILIAVAIVLVITPTSAHAEEFQNVTDKPAPITFHIPNVIDWTINVANRVHEKAEAVCYTGSVENYSYEYYEPSYSNSGYSGTNLMTDGVVCDGGTRYTWYSERVLPGGGLNIPGRHVNSDGFVVDGNGNICVASSDLPYGTAVSTPWGDGVVYDGGCASGTVDIYTSW